MRKILTLFFLILFSGYLHAQRSELVFSGNFVETPFSEFVSSIESSTTIRFFFESDMVKEVRVNASGKNLKMSEVLQTAFSPANLKFYIDNFRNVIIYKGVASVIERLPDFKQEETGNITPEQPENAELTNTEKKYLDGKILVEIETIVTGDRQKMVQGQNCVVRGSITVRETGEPLVGATIYIEETGTGAMTDQDGYFRLILKPGKYSAKASYISMKEKPFYLQVYSDGFILIRMEKAIISISEVTISAKRNDNVVGMQMGFEHILTKNMKEIPVALGERDLLKVATLLPGVQTAGEGASGIIVRGGTADQNLFYLNKIPVYNTSHIFGFFTAFSPDVVSDFTLYKSNIPASYGGRVSSIFDISTRQGNKKKFFGQGGISPVTGHFELEGPVIKDKSSFVISARSTYSDWLLSRMSDINLKNSNTNFL
jgi:hypothetical protein